MIREAPLWAVPHGEALRSTTSPPQADTSINALDLGGRLGCLEAGQEALKADLDSPLDKLLPRKRCSIETLLAKLKPGMGLEHTGHRSPINAFVPILSCLLAPAKANMGTVASLPLTSPAWIWNRNCNACAEGIVPQRFREGRPWCRCRCRCRCSPQTCRLAEDLAGIGSRVMRLAPPHCPLLHGGAPPPDHPPALWGRATVVRVQVSSPNVPAG